MNAAFSVWEDRIAPVFDVTTELVIVAHESISDGTRRIRIRDNTPSALIATLLEEDVSTLICGAISRPLSNAVTTHTITLHPFISGDLNTVMQAWRAGELESESFRMPGYGHRRGRCHGNQDAPPGQRGTGRMNRFGRRRGSRPITSQTNGGAIQPSSGTGSRQSSICRCPQCGLTMPHVPGEPCSNKLCPNCHAPMVRA